MNKAAPLDSDFSRNSAVFLEKGVSEIFPNREFVEQLLRTAVKPLTLYAGFDPTAPTLHLGHTIQLRKLRQWQELGHKVVFLVGDFTALIGDPTDKLAARTQLTEAEVKKNLKRYKAQAGRIIRFSGKNKAVIRFNSKWLKKMKLQDVISLSSLVTVDQMLKRDMFNRRTEEGKPIYMHEFLYPLMQGYDSVALGVDGEVGGTDQTFNMLMGRTLEQKLLQREKFVITMKLLEDGSGKKMGKSEGNMVALDESPSQMYGKVMSWPDTVVPSAFELLTDLDSEAVSILFTHTPHPKDQKMKLAFEVTRGIFGEKEAVRAQEAFVQTFQKGEIPEQVQVVSINNQPIDTLLLTAKVVESVSALRRLTDVGAVVHLETGEKVATADIKKVPVPGTYKIGKNRFIKLV